jgi:hypothetical protein
MIWRSVKFFTLPGHELGPLNSPARKQPLNRLRYRRAVAVSQPMFIQGAIIVS